MSSLSRSLSQSPFISHVGNAYSDQKSLALLREYQQASMGLLGLSNTVLPLILEGAKVPVEYLEGDMRKIFDVITCAHEFSDVYRRLLNQIIATRRDKIHFQCQKLSAMGCNGSKIVSPQIRLPNGIMVDFDSGFLSARFPQSGSMIHEGHIAQAFMEIPRNRAILKREIGQWMDTDDFIRECLYVGGKYAIEVSLESGAHYLDSYRPTLESLAGYLDVENTIVSFSGIENIYATVEEFRQQVGRLVELGINALDINNNTSLHWVDEIKETSNRYNLLLTQSSPSQNPYVDPLSMELTTSYPRV